MVICGMTSAEETYLRAFSNVNVTVRIELGHATQYDFAKNIRWHHKQWSLYEKTNNMKLLTTCECAENLKLSGPQYLRRVADELESLQKQETVRMAAEDQGKYKSNK